ncbi:MAG: hypothetical protein K2H20_00470 [Bacilli bacterium]|nr:hypothetical protein [Bacilli bacterium]
MKDYYRTTDMINLIEFFPELSPVRDLTIVESVEEYIKNKDYFDSFKQNRVDTLKGRTPILGIENAGKSNGFYETIVKVKEKDPEGVLVLFNIDSEPTERYERYAGISIGVDVGESIYIDAVGQGFDGREVSKSICTHERYYIPWFDIRKLTIENFNQYQTFLINQSDYKNTREERINFLESIGLEPKNFLKYIPEVYEPIPDFVWSYVILKVIKKLVKIEDDLVSYGFIHFAISGHTEGKKWSPWGMFDKSRYELAEKKDSSKN